MAKKVIYSTTFLMLTIIFVLSLLSCTKEKNADSEEHVKEKEAIHEEHTNEKAIIDEEQINEAETPPTVSHNEDTVQNKNVVKPEIIKKHKYNYTIIEKIIRSSPEFKNRTKNLAKAIIENGGIGWELENHYTEEVTINEISKYYFSLYEVYDNRSPRIASYVFDTDTKQLYLQKMYDDEESEFGTLMPIEFNKQLLSKLK